MLLSEISIFECYRSKGIDLKYFSPFVPFKHCSRMVK